MNRALAILEIGNNVTIERVSVGDVLQSRMTSKIINLAINRTKGEAVIVTLQSGHVITLKSWGILESELDAAEAARAKTERKRK